MVVGVAEMRAARKPKGLEPEARLSGKTKQKAQLARC